MQSRFTILSIAALAALSISGRVSAQQQETPPATNPPTQSGAQAQPQAPEPVTGSPAAAEPVTDAGKKSATEEIVVTGSRIRRKDLTTPAPVTVISREQVVQSGKISVGDFLQTLPEQGNATNTSVNNSGDGSTRVSLRGLGTARTLVLVNGRRFVPGGTGADSSVDLNSIPTASIERVEILKDGASAVYGSDAIGGVVNIITRKGFKGTEVAGTAGISSRGDGSTYDINATTGQAGERGNVVFSGGYYQQKPVWAGDRDWASVPVGYCANEDCAGNLGLSQGVFTQGSGTIPEGRIILSKNPAVRIGGGSSLYNALTNTYKSSRIFIHCDPATDSTCNPALNWRPYRGSALSAADNAIAGLPSTAATGDGYNFQPQNYLVTPQQRISLYSIGDLSLGSNSRGYYEASYVNRQSEQRLAPEPLLTDLEGVTVSANSIYNPFGRDITAVRRRLLEFGNRVFNQDIDTFRVVGGLDGTLPEEIAPLKGWFWDVSLNYGRTEQAGTKHGNLRNPRIQDAIGPSMRINGVPTCLKTAGDATTAIDGCVPLNLLGGAGTIGADQAAPLSYTGVDRGINQMTAVQFNTSGELFTLAADRPAALAAGYEYRLLYGSAIPDPITVAGETTGNKSLITRGGYHVNEGYAELSLPIISNITGAEALEGTGAVRVFNYSTFGTDYTYKFGGRWRVIHDLTFRGTYSTAFRAPSIGDLYGGQGDNFAPVQDPCRNLATAPASCGAAAGNGDDQTQLRSRVGGNPDLKPETAKIYTVGVVIEPSMVKNLSFTVDYYHFDLAQTLSSLGESVILSGCYPAAGGTPKYCNLIVRDPVTQRITQIYNLNQNVGSTVTDGIDVSVRYALPTEVGRFGAIFDGTWLHKYDVTLGDGSVIKAKGNYDLAGQTGSGAGGAGGYYPAFKFNTGATWSLAGANAGATWRFVSAGKECGDADGIMNGSGLCYQDDTYQRRIDYYNTFDLFLGYALQTNFGRTAFAVGVNNVADKKPNKIYNGFLAASDPSAYDYMGRFVYGRITQTF